ncbi:MAG: molybdate ABC transporter substrate-binding protein [Candidatus Dormibacteraeota bacterium]|nr:molybdate ABC transporter substrate-binding protein [Candidatus Dormibacteraeota bacterium]
MLIGLLAAAVGLLAACGGSSSSTASPPPSPDTVKGKITVLAAASLTAAFNQIGGDFQKQHAAASVAFSFAGSPTLVTQIQQGSPADVFASADEANMAKVTNGLLAVGTPTIFAQNRLQIVVAAGNPKHITSLADLAQPSIKVVVCAPGVPCGTYATQAFTKAAVKVTAVSQEDNVKSVVTKVSLGEADAGIVYVTDVKAGGSTVQGVDIPDTENVVAKYPMVQLKAATNAASAQAFIAYVTGSQGRQTLTKFGFLPPS